MALFGGSKPKSINADALRNILEQGLRKQKSVLGQGFTQLPGLGKGFEQKAGQLGEEFVTGATGRAQEFARGLQQVEDPSFVKREQGKAQELAFRNLPAVQQQIRENLAATGGLQRGAATRALQAPVLQASRAASDAGFQIQQQAAGREIERKERGLDTIFQTEQGAALTKLGIDRNTASILLQTGREDILNKAMSIAGIEQQRTQGLLDIEQLRQTSDIARQQSKRAGLGRVLSGVGSLAGTGLGFALGGGPVGALIGSQVGGQLGFAGGGQSPDLSGILAFLAARRQGGSAQPTPIKKPIAPAFNPGR